MMYGIITENGVVAYRHSVGGSKPMITTTPNTPQGYRATYEWVDSGNEIVQKYTYIPLTQEELEEIERYKKDKTVTAEDKAEAYDILMGVTE